jgi:CRP/FNR family transcriptional regulator
MSRALSKQLVKSSLVQETLKNCLLFKGLGDDDLEKMESIAAPKRYGKNEVIFSEGEVAKGFYVLASGRVKVYKLSHEGKEQILHIIWPYEIFAEVAMFAGSGYPAFAEAILSSEVVFFEKKTFFALLKKHPQLSVNMIANLSFRLREFTRLVEELSLKDVSTRLARYLKEQASLLKIPKREGVGFELEVNKAQLASQLGTIPETLSRTLRKMREEKVLRLEGKRVIILNMKALENIAAGLKP